MLKHKKQHTAPTVQCSTCEYEGTPLALKEHTKTTRSFKKHNMQDLLQDLHLSYVSLEAS